MTCRTIVGRQLGRPNDADHPVTLKPRKPLASFRLPDWDKQSFDQSKCIVEPQKRGAGRERDTRDPNQWLPYMLYACTAWLGECSPCISAPGHGAPPDHTLLVSHMPSIRSPGTTSTHLPCSCTEQLTYNCSPITRLGNPSWLKLT
jgi:hypothetical protein